MLQSNFLWYLVQIEQYRSLSLAAEKLHISQPALSSAIKTLENQLNTKLLHRTYKGVTLTEDGKKVVALAEKAFAYFDEIESLFRQPATAKEMFFLDNIKIYTNPAFSPMLITALSQAYNTSQTSKSLQINNMAPGLNIVQLLHENPTAVVITIVPEIFSIPDTISKTILGKSKSYIMCAETADFFPPEQTTVSFEELLDIPLAVTNQSFVFLDTLLNILKTYGTPNVKIISPDSASVTAAISSGTAVSFSNRFYRNNNMDNFRFLPIRNAPNFHFAMLYNHKIDQTKIDYLKELLSEFLV